MQSSNKSSSPATVVDRGGGSLPIAIGRETEGYDILST